MEVMLLPRQNDIVYFYGSYVIATWLLWYRYCFEVIGVIIGQNDIVYFYGSYVIATWLLWYRYCFEVIGVIIG
jgi:hypothetical protein